MSCELSSEAECQAGGAESEIEAAGLGVARAGVKQLRGDAEGASEQACIGAVKAGEAGEGRERVGMRRVGKCDLILLGEVGLVLTLCARERIDEFAIASGIARASGAVGGVLCERVKGGGQCRLRQITDRGFFRLRISGIGEQVLVAGRRLRA